MECSVRITNGPRLLEREESASVRAKCHRRSGEAAAKPAIQTFQAALAEKGKLDVAMLEELCDALLKAWDFRADGVS